LGLPAPLKRQAPGQHAHRGPLGGVKHQPTKTVTAINFSASQQGRRPRTPIPARNTC
jgi:hypothetical protein